MLLRIVEPKVLYNVRCKRGFLWSLVSFAFLICVRLLRSLFLFILISCNYIETICLYESNRFDLLRFILWLTIVVLIDRCRFVRVHTWHHRSFNRLILSVKNVAGSFFTEGVLDDEGFTSSTNSEFIPYHLRVIIFANSPQMYLTFYLYFKVSTYDGCCTWASE